MTVNYVRMVSILFSLLPLDCNMALAKDARLSLAHEIQKVSETRQVSGGNKVGNHWFPEIRVKQQIKVAGCDATVEIEETRKQGTRIYGLTFDLARTQVPDPHNTDSALWRFVELESSVKFADMIFLFTDPYTPTPHGNPHIPIPNAPVKYYPFGMAELQDDERPRRLLTLLRKYQEEYCTFTG